MSWEKVKLGDIAEFSNGVNFDKSAYAPGIKLISVSNFGNRFYPDYSELSEISADAVKKNDYLQHGDIVFVRSNGNKELVGRCMLIDNPPTHTTYSGFCIRARVKDTTRFNPKFLTYHFKHDGFRIAMAGNAVGANIQNLSQGRLSAYIAHIPPIETQHRIADTLSAYDDLIENNRKQIKLLEEAAQRLYKEWFVDLRFPGHEHTKIVDGVPEEWRIRAVSDFGEVITGKTPSTSKPEYYDGNIPFVTIPDMHNAIFPLSTEKYLSEQGANTQKNKFLPPDSVMVSCIATVGLVNIASERCQTNQQINSVILKDKKDLYFFYFAMKRIKSLLDGVGSNGATMTNVNKTKFESIKILYPGKYLTNCFFEFSMPIFQKVLVLSKENQNLQQACDRLLPKLMSGEVEV
mgnify:FL=1